MFFKSDKMEAKRSLESLERAQKLLDERFEKQQIDFGAYQKQCQEFGKRREKLRKALGEELFQEVLAASNQKNGFFQ